MVIQAVRSYTLPDGLFVFSFPPLTPGDIGFRYIHA